MMTGIGSGLTPNNMFREGARYASRDHIHVVPHTVVGENPERESLDENFTSMIFGSKETRQCEMEDNSPVIPEIATSMTKSIVEGDHKPVAIDKNIPEDSGKPLKVELQSDWPTIGWNHAERTLNIAKSETDNTHGISNIWEVSNDSIKLESNSDWSKEDAGNVVENLVDMIKAENDSVPTIDRDTLLKYEFDREPDLNEISTMHEFAGHVSRPESTCESGENVKSKELLTKDRSESDDVNQLLGIVKKVETDKKHPRAVKRQNGKTKRKRLGRQEENQKLCVLAKNLPEAYVRLERIDDLHDLACLGKSFTTASPSGNVTDSTDASKEILNEKKMQDKPDGKDESNMCTICKKSFKSKPGLRMHIKGQHMEKQYACLVCEATFSGASLLRDHIMIHTGEKPFQCTTCGHKFRRKAHLLRHTLKHTGERKHKCQYCEKAFMTGEHLNRHVRAHTGERPYLCSVCGKGYTRWTTLRVHQRSHSKEKPYICDICGCAWKKAFPLQRHMLTHTGQRPYKCMICDASFTRSDHFKVHQTTHTGEKPYKCAVCERGFGCLPSLKGHFKTHSNEKLFNCLLCKNKAFRTRKYLKNHVKKRHPGYEIFYCSHCEESFVKEADLQFHVNIKHSATKLM